MTLSPDTYQFSSCDLPLKTQTRISAYVTTLRGRSRGARPAVLAQSDGESTLVCCRVCLAAQNALPYMFLARIALAAAHGAALKAAGMPNPFLLSAAMHTAAVFISACMRVGLVKAFHRWQKDNTRKEGTAKEAALSYEGNMEDVQQRGKLKVQ